MSAWTALPSYDGQLQYRVAGCELAAQDSDIWPAYAVVMIGDTGQYDLNVAAMTVLSDLFRIVIVLLTFLKRSLESDKASHVRSALVRTMYRDGWCARPYSLHMTSLGHHIVN